MSERFDTIVVGTGFASVFFLERHLTHAPANERILVLDRGEQRDHQWYVDNRGGVAARAEREFENATPEKPWVFTVGVGGGSNCWYACTPRMLPEDFELQTRYGRGDDWPISYDDLELYYCEAEELMSISGASDAPFPMSRPYPLPGHTLSPADEMVARAHPGLLVPQPTARPSQDVAGKRPKCCANGVCAACPIDSKFTILNSLRGPLEDARVTVRPNANVERIEVADATARGVYWTDAEGKESFAAADLVVLGANAIFNPAILLRSGIDHPAMGRGLVEQTAVNAQALLDGVDSFTGSTWVSGHGYMLYGGAHRADHAAAVIEFANVPVFGVRLERGRWRQRMELKLIYEDLRQDSNRVELGTDPRRPRTVFEGHSQYTLDAMDRAQTDLERIFDGLPVESVSVVHRPDTEAHVLGTAVMGADPATSIVDHGLVHHEIRNLVVAGGSSFVTAAPANPSLTISALSLRAADRLHGVVR